MKAILGEGGPVCKELSGHEAFNKAYNHHRQVTSMDYQSPSNPSWLKVLAGTTLVDALILSGEQKSPAPPERQPR
jgi:hypothetical protein